MNNVQMTFGTLTIQELLKMKLSFNPSKRTQKDYLKELIKSIKNVGGITNPISVGYDNLIGDGHRRLTACDQYFFWKYEHELRASDQSLTEEQIETMARKLTNAVSLPVMFYPTFDAIELYHLENDSGIKKSHDDPQALDAFVSEDFKWKVLTQSQVKAFKLAIAAINANPDAVLKELPLLDVALLDRDEGLTDYAKGVLTRVRDIGKGTSYIREMHRMQSYTSPGAMGSRSTGVELIDFIEIVLRTGSLSSLRIIRKDYDMAIEKYPNKHAPEWDKAISDMYANGKVKVKTI